MRDGRERLSSRIDDAVVDTYEDFGIESHEYLVIILTQLVPDTVAAAFIKASE